MAGPLGGLCPGLTRNGTRCATCSAASIVAMYVGYLVLLRYVRRVPPRWVIGAILAVHVIFLMAPPLALTDIFNYINYGRMEVVHHLNPYTTIPILEPHTDPSYTLSNWHQLLSPYGPAVHAADVRGRAARGGRVVLGAEGPARAFEPRDAAARVALRAHARPRSGRARSRSSD